MMKRHWREDCLLTDDLFPPLGAHHPTIKPSRAAESMCGFQLRQPKISGRQHAFTRQSPIVQSEHVKAGYRYEGTV